MWKYKCNKAILITTSGFTLQAKKQAEESPVELWNLETLKEFVQKYMIDKFIEEKQKNDN